LLDGERRPRRRRFTPSYSWRIFRLDVRASRAWWKPQTIQAVTQRTCRVTILRHSMPILKL